MSQNVNLLFLRMYWKHSELKKSRGVIICSGVFQDLFNHDLSTYELFDLLVKYFTIFESKSHCIKLTLISMLSLKGELDKKTKGTPRSFERSLNKNTAILENLVTKLWIWGVLKTKTTPRAFWSLPGH